MPNSDKRATAESRPAVVDLFCGAGGFSLAAWWAGFCVHTAVDIDPLLTQSFERNFPHTTLMHADLRRQDVLENVLPDPQIRIAGIIGGPPCQGISMIGRRDVGDLRNGLVVRFFDYVAHYSPKFFIMENVPGLATDAYAQLLEVALERIPHRYEVLPYMLLDSHEFGAATSRVRFIIVGYEPSSVDDIRASDFEPRSCTIGVTVRDAISDLPDPQFVPETEALPYREVEELSNYARGLRQPPSAELGSDDIRRQSKEMLVTGNSLTRHSANVVARFGLVPPGGQDRISRYRRLVWDAPAPVLRAGTGRDRGSYQAARPIHPEEHRVITVREAARMQGFPDWFEFSDTKWHSHRMIGNSICPIFATQLLSVIRDHIG